MTLAGVGMGAGMTLVGGAVAALALTVALAPAVLFGPPAVVYEACSAAGRLRPSKEDLETRRSRLGPKHSNRSRKNPFALAATGGVQLVGAGVVGLIKLSGGYESD